MTLFIEHGEESMKEEEIILMKQSILTEVLIIQQMCF